MMSEKCASSLFLATDIDEAPERVNVGILSFEIRETDRKRWLPFGPFFFFSSAHFSRVNSVSPNDGAWRGARQRSALIFSSPPLETRDRTNSMHSLHARRGQSLP